MPQGRLRVLSGPAQQRAPDLGPGKSLPFVIPSGGWYVPWPQASSVRQIERVDRAAHVLESHLAVIRRADAHAGAFDDGFCQRPEAGAPMDAAFQHYETLLHRI